MRVKCLKCGVVLDEADLVERVSPIGEYMGLTATETYYCCPVCGGDETAEAVECSICGEWHIKEPGYDDVTMHDGVCEDCLCKATVEECERIAQDEGKHMVALNAFFASAFTAEEIEDILRDTLKRAPRKAVTDYIMGDPEWFSERFVARCAE